jgi:transcription antitermination factor NusG
MMPDQEVYWFVARTRNDQELGIRNKLKKLDIDCFLPTSVVVKQLKYRKKKIEVPRLRNLIFIHTTKEKACSVHNDYGIPIFYMKDMQTHSLLVVPEKQMLDFMFVMDIGPDSVSFGNGPLAAGEKVRVVKGEFAGIEGEVVSIANSSRVIIRIPQVFFVSLRIPKAHLVSLPDGSAIK